MAIAEDLGVLAAPSILDRLPTEEQRSKHSDDGIGETIIKALSRMDDAERKTPAQSAEPNPASFQAPLPTAVDADDRPKGMMADQHSTAAQPIEHRAPTEKVQAARFYSRTLSEWLWTIFDYPGERSGFDEVSQILRLSNCTGWRLFPRSGPPADGYARYFTEELSQLRGKTAAEVLAFHLAMKAGKKRVEMSPSPLYFPESGLYVFE